MVCDLVFLSTLCIKRSLSWVSDTSRDVLNYRTPALASPPLLEPVREIFFVGPPDVSDVII
jgi:hypothetical protein